MSDDQLIINLKLLEIFLSDPVNNEAIRNARIHLGWIIGKLEGSSDD